MDMDAGIEHLGRATTKSMDALLVVVDEGPWSVHTAHRVRALAKDIGLSSLAAVVNRVHASTNLEAIRSWLDGIPIVGTIPHDHRLLGGIVRGADHPDLKPTEVLTDLLPHIDSILQSVRALARGV